jgi:hypothetical protein
MTTSTAVRHENNTWVAAMAATAGMAPGARERMRAKLVELRRAEFATTTARC